MWIIPIDGNERRRATRRRPTCAHERRIHPLPLSALRVDPLSASARLRVEVHLHPSDERPPHKLGGRPRRVQVATQGEPVLQGAADEHEHAGRSARSVPAVRQVGEAEGGGRPDGDRRGRGAVRRVPHRSPARAVGCDEQLIGARSRRGENGQKTTFSRDFSRATFRARHFRTRLSCRRDTKAMSPPDADTSAGLSEVDLERSLKGERATSLSRSITIFPRLDSTRNVFARSPRFPPRAAG